MDQLNLIRAKELADQIREHNAIVGVHQLQIKHKTQLLRDIFSGPQDPKKPKGLKEKVKDMLGCCLPKEPQPKA